jgi:hypothetical protein
VAFLPESTNNARKFIGDKYDGNIYPLLDAPGVDSDEPSPRLDSILVLQPVKTCVSVVDPDGEHPAPRRTVTGENLTARFFADLA